MNHVVLGAALGSLVVLLSWFLNSDTPLGLDYYLLTVCFGSGASVIYKRMVLKI